jgi:hypothetical protein
MELGLLHRFLELIHGRAIGPGCVWLAIFGAELVFWIWSCVELSHFYMVLVLQTKSKAPITYGISLLLFPTRTTLCAFWPRRYMASAPFVLATSQQVVLLLY